MMATRNTSGVDVVPVSNSRHFTLLEDANAQHELITTLRRQLARGYLEDHLL
jgi:hypothetical protein